MPLTLILAHKLNRKLSELRRSGEMDWLRADSKTQVTIEYEKAANGAVKPLRVDTVVISTQHADEITTADLQSEIMEKVVKTVIDPKLLDDKTVYHIQPSGRFVIGGPQGDAGLTGRKIIVDSYGGWGAHGGGAFSGKDWSKVDRSAAYAGRWIAKSLVAAGLAERCLVQLSYAIGVAAPLSIFCDSYGTVKSGLTDGDLVKIISKNFDLRPGIIVRDLGMQKPIYAQTACYGHFGNPDYPWEKVRVIFPPPARRMWLTCGRLYSRGSSTRPSRGRNSLHMRAQLLRHTHLRISKGQKLPVEGSAHDTLASLGRGGAARYL